MPMKKKIKVPQGVFFITFTCSQWLPLIELANAYDLVYKWFDHLKTWGHYINGYVLMPNHIHALLAFRNTGRLINNFIGDGKKVLAYEMVKRLELIDNDQILNELRLEVKPADYLKKQKHDVWEDSFDWKECKTHEFMLQKLNYIHKNPCRGKWNLALTPADYDHCSARFYEKGIHAAYPVTHYLDLEHIDLKKPLIY
jgi:REP element-mobilizing transposase RayT